MKLRPLECAAVLKALAGERLKPREERALVPAKQKLEKGARV